MDELPESPYPLTMLVCTRERDGDRAACGNRGSLALCLALRKRMSRLGLKGKIRIVKSGCLDRCEHGPNIAVFPDETWYEGVTEADLDALEAKHLAPLARKLGVSPKPAP